jgi:hypothetical protein
MRAHATVIDSPCGWQHAEVRYVSVPWIVMLSEVMQRIEVTRRLDLSPTAGSAGAERGSE